MPFRVATFIMHCRKHMIDASAEVQAILADLEDDVFRCAEQKIRERGVRKISVEEDFEAAKVALDETEARDD